MDSMSDMFRKKMFVQEYESPRRKHRRIKKKKSSLSISSNSFNPQEVGDLSPSANKAQNNRTVCCQVACCDSQANVYYEDGSFDTSSDVIARPRVNRRRF